MRGLDPLDRRRGGRTDGDHVAATVGETVVGHDVLPRRHRADDVDHTGHAGGFVHSGHVHDVPARRHHEPELPAAQLARLTQTS